MGEIPPKGINRKYKHPKVFMNILRRNTLKVAACDKKCIKNIKSVLYVCALRSTKQCKRFILVNYTHTIQRGIIFFCMMHRFLPCYWHNNAYINNFFFWFQHIASWHYTLFYYYIWPILKNTNFLTLITSQKKRLWR